MLEYLGLEYFIEADRRIYWLYLASAIIIALFFSQALKEQFSRSTLLHPSSLLDYRYFIVVSIIKVTIILPLMVSVHDVILWFVTLLNSLFGYQLRIRVSKEWLLIAYTLTLFIANDFTRYWLHRWMHQSSLLWRFHKLHHSAERLNPFTFYRVHPVENILFGIRYALTSGVVTALFIYYFGAGIGIVEFMGVNILLFIFLIAGANLRHSHIPLSYGRMMERWFISPYQHQLHHSKEYTHSNFGSSLAIWDRLFGTLVTIKPKKLEFGLPNEVMCHSLLQALIKPFKKGKTV
jgi:sterol desaturase/sphingolipid hydroxylase (fatty acid hydroxylase superfamily)